MKTYQLTTKEFYGQCIQNYADYQEYLEKREEAIRLDVLVPSLSTPVSDEGVL